MTTLPFYTRRRGGYRGLLGLQPPPPSLENGEICTIKDMNVMYKNHCSDPDIL